MKSGPWQSGLAWNWTVWAIIAGRGFAKTRTAAENSLRASAAGDTLAGCGPTRATPASSESDLLVVSTAGPSGLGALDELRSRVMLNKLIPVPLVASCTFAATAVDIPPMKQMRVNGVDLPYLKQGSGRPTRRVIHDVSTLPCSHFRYRNALHFRAPIEPSASKQFDMLFCFNGSFWPDVF